MELSKNDSKMLQGLSVIAMVFLHLFDRDYYGLFSPLLFIRDTPLSFYFGQISDFCVFGFAFLSGYGHLAQFGKIDFYKRRLKGLLSLLCSYWLILIVFSLISILTGKSAFMPGSAKEFIFNFFLLEYYNGAWWYMLTYAVLVAISPLVLKAIKKWKPITVLGLGFSIYCLAYYIRFKMDSSNWFLARFGPFGMTLFEFILGALAYKYKVFSCLFERWKRIPRTAQIILAIIILIGMIYGHTKIIPSLFIAPVTGFVIVMLFHFWQKPRIIIKLFAMIGEHSTNIWLTHMFFFKYIFNDFVYVAKYPILIFLFIMIITVFLSIILKQIERPIHKQIARM